MAHNFMMEEVYFWIFYHSLTPSWIILLFVAHNFTLCSSHMGSPWRTTLTHALFYSLVVGLHMVLAHGFFLGG